MNWFDFTIIFGALVSTLAGIYWGFIRQAITLAGLVLAIWLAAHFNTQVAGIFFFVSDEQGRKVAAFLLILIGVSGLIGVAASVAHTTVGLLFLGLFDHVAGSLLGFVQFLVLITAVIIGGTIFQVPWLSEAVSHSLIAGWITQPLGFVAGLFPPELGGLWQQFRS